MSGTTRKNRHPVSDERGRRQRTSCHDVPGSGSTAPLHQKATRTTARPHSSGATGEPATPHISETAWPRRGADTTHIYKENFGRHGLNCKIFLVDFFVVEAGPGNLFLKPPGRKNEPIKGSTTSSTRFPFFRIQGPLLETCFYSFIEIRRFLF